MTITQLEPTSAIPKSIAHLTREGTENICGSRATLKLSRYEDVLDYSRSQLDVVLAHNKYNDVDVMTMKSNGDVNIVKPNGLKVNNQEVALSSAIPVPTDFINTNTISATASPGTTAGVGVVGNTSGVEFQFTLPKGDQGIQGNSITGPTGPKGDKGDQGNSITGATGPKGDKGDQGNSITGAKGDKGDTGAGLNSSGVLDISKDGEVAKFQPATSGSHTLVNFNSKVNSGSDKGFILVQDESAQSPGTSGEDLCMTIGVYNDFLQSTAHSDELWFQGGGRLCYNVGSWDSELNTIIGTPGAGTSHGGVKHEWRINNIEKMKLNDSGLTCTNGDNSSSYYGPNSTWGSYLLTGSGTNKIGSRQDLAQVLSTNGNLHLDAGVTRDMYLNYYAGRDIYLGNGNSGTHGIIKQNGKIGILTTNPSHPLDVAGIARATSFISNGDFQTTNAIVVRLETYAMDQFAWRRVVPQRFTGTIVWTPLANDHAAVVYNVAQNSNAVGGDLSRPVQQSDYYSIYQYITWRWNGGWLEFSKAGVSPSFSNPHMYHVTIYGAII